MLRKQIQPAEISSDTETISIYESYLNVTKDGINNDGGQRSNLDRQLAQKKLAINT